MKMTESTSEASMPGLALSFSIAYRTARRKIRLKTYLQIRKYNVARPCS